MSYYALYFTTKLLTTPEPGGTATPRRGAAARAFIAQLARDVEGHVGQLEVRYLTSALWCLGRLGHKQAPAVLALCGEIQRHVSQASPTCCANTLQSLVRLDVNN